MVVVMTLQELLFWVGRCELVGIGVSVRKWLLGLCV